MSAYRFALRPRWILSHVLVAALVVVMVNLGFWQLRRLEEKRGFNALVDARQGSPTVPVESLASSSPDSVAYRSALAAGSYDTEREVMVRSRSLHEQPGVWVLTPLVLPDGRAIVVNRGWIPTQGVPDRVPADAAPEDGDVTITGIVMKTQTRGRFGPKDPPSGTLTDLARADIERLQQQVPYDLYPVYLQLDSQGPPQSTGLPEPLGPLELDEGPHLGYAAQWFIFSAIAAGGYPLILRRRARELDRETDPVVLSHLMTVPRSLGLRTASVCAALMPVGDGEDHVDDIAREAGCSRATVYRAFPGGKEQLIEAPPSTGSWPGSSGPPPSASTPRRRSRTCSSPASPRPPGSSAATPTLQYLLAHEPETVLPHLAFQRGGAVLPGCRRPSPPRTSPASSTSSEAAPAGEWVAPGRPVVHVRARPDDVDLTDETATRALRPHLSSSPALRDPQQGMSLA